MARALRRLSVTLYVHWRLVRSHFQYSCDVLQCVCDISLIVRSCL